jgi:hypothetical protein
MAKQPNKDKSVKPKKVVKADSTKNKKKKVQVDANKILANLSYSHIERLLRIDDHLRLLPA